MHDFALSVVICSAAMNSCVRLLKVVSAFLAFSVGSVGFDEKPHQFRK